MIATEAHPALAVRCLQLLEAAAGVRFMTAAEIAEVLRLPGNRETQRRAVRALVEYLRERGSMIIANLANGYLLTYDPQVYRDYLDGRQIDAKRLLGETGRQKRTICDGWRQGFLFFPNKV
jgi:biotin operon repressor